MEAHTTIAGERGSGDRLDKLDRGRTTVAIDRVDLRLHDTARSGKRNDGDDGCSPLDPQRDLELLHRRVQVRHDETDVKELVVDRRRQLDLLFEPRCSSDRRDTPPPRHRPPSRSSGYSARSSAAGRVHPESQPQGRPSYDRNRQSDAGAWAASPSQTWIGRSRHGPCSSEDRCHAPSTAAPPSESATVRTCFTSDQTGPT
jgi:hypothetical protein